MKNLSLFILVICLLSFSCSKQVGELVPAPEGMKENLTAYLSSTDCRLIDFSVRKYPSEVYLVVANFERTKFVPKRPTIDSLDFIAQKNTENIWQFSVADKERLKIFNITK